MTNIFEKNLKIQENLNVMKKGSFEIDEKTGMPVNGYVTVKIRRWKDSIDGNQISPVTRTKGSYNEWETVSISKNLLTNAGRDDFIDKCYIHNGAGSAAGNFVAMSNDATAPAVGDTTLAGEITSNGLARAQMPTRTHTAGTNSWSLVITFTATASQSAQKAGLFNASSNGTLSNENTFTQVNLSTNDQIQLTWSGTLG